MRLSLTVNVVLTAFKFFAGIAGLSRAMIADALHSLSDILTSVIAYVGIIIGARPADDDHPYGHGNAETIAAVLVALTIIGAGIYAGVSAVSAIARGSYKTPLNIALFAAVISIFVKELLFRYVIWVGRQSNNPAVIADAWHHRSDSLSSVAAAVGIVGAKVSFSIFDPIAGFVVSGFIFKIGFQLIRSNVGIIMDERPQETFFKRIRQVVSSTGGVRGIDSLKVHRRGSTFTVDIEIAVDDAISVKEGHQIASDVRDKLRKEVKNIQDVMVHVNPVL